MASPIRNEIDISTLPGYLFGEDERGVVIDKVKAILKKCSTIYGVANKLKCTTEMYEYLSHCPHFLRREPKFTYIVYTKLIEFEIINKEPEVNVMAQKYMKEMFADRPPFLDHQKKITDEDVKYVRDTLTEIELNYDPSKSKELAIYLFNRVQIIREHPNIKDDFLELLAENHEKILAVDQGAINIKILISVFKRLEQFI